MYPSESSLQGLCVGLSVHYCLLGPRDYCSGLFMAPHQAAAIHKQNGQDFLQMEKWKAGKK